MDPALDPTNAKRKSRKASQPKRDHLALAQGFEADILEGRFPAGSLFKAAVKRHHADLARVSDPAFPYTFNPDVGAKLCRFIEGFLVHVEGPESIVGKPIILEPWQLWFLLVAFGWVSKVTGNPRFRRVTLFLPKGQGKTLLCAAIAAYVLCTDKGASTLVSAATTREQAKLSFNNARMMLLRNPQLRERFGLVVEEHQIKRPETGAKFRPVSSEANSVEGLLPRLVVEDEIHCHANRDLHDNLRSASAKRPDSVTLVISTAGFDLAGIGYEVYGYAKDVLTGNVSDDSQFALLIEADRDSDPFDPKTWRIANPNLGVSIDPVEVENEANEARQVASKRASFLTKRLGWWVQSANPWLDMARFDACASTLDRSQFKGQPCWVGVDLASKTDLASVAYVFPYSDNGKTEYAVFVDNYINEAAVTQSKNASYPGWAADGHLIVTPGDVTDFGAIESDIIRAGTAYQVMECAVDPWQATQLAQNLNTAGLTTVEVRPIYAQLSEPMKQVEALILEKRFHHDGSPVNRWCFGNVIPKLDGKDNQLPGKDHPSKKIDPVLAVLTAFARALVNDSGGGADLLFI